ncbi:MAG: tetratricopeptide repeat protein [candidate division Zixibacteria bacterium]|nr:tetratricopeptide repeat protein [candidate division Zixibacteria bacterium]
MRTFPLPKNLVILPFTNVGGDPANQALCNGLGEAVNGRISQLEKWQASLRVAPRSDIRKYEVYSAEEARKILGANLAVGGSVKRGSREVRLTIELVDTKSNSIRPLRTAFADFAMNNAAAIPEWTVRKLTEMLEIKLPRQALQELGRGGSSVSSASLAYLRGRGYLQHYEDRENLDIAIALLERALQEDPLYGLAYAALGEAYWHRYQATNENQWKERALDNCDRAVRLNQQLALAHVTLGQINSGESRYQEGLEEFQKALGHDSLNVEACRGLAEAYQALGQSSRAESTYLKAIKQRPNYPAGYSHLGAFYYRRGEYEKAAAQFEQVVKLAPENYRGYNSLGGVYIQSGRPSDAEEMFKRSLAIEPDAATYSNLGTLYFFEVGRYAEAARMHEKALEIDSGDYRIWGNLASAYYWSPGERAKARAAYQRAVRLAEETLAANSRDAAHVSHLARFYAMLGEENRALPLLEQSLTLAVDDPDVLARAGGAYEQLGRREKALECIRRALEKGYPLKTVEQSPGLAKLRLDPRFMSMAEKISNKL